LEHRRTVAFILAFFAGLFAFMSGNNVDFGDVQANRAGVFWTFCLALVFLGLYGLRSPSDSGFLVLFRNFVVCFLGAAFLMLVGTILVVNSIDLSHLIVRVEGRF
jgi:hypothetical protein